LLTAHYLCQTTGSSKSQKQLCCEVSTSVSGNFASLPIFACWVKENIYVVYKWYSSAEVSNQQHSKLGEMEVETAGSSKCIITLPKISPQKLRTHTSPTILRI
jgi:hypothetical protein